MQVTNSIVQKHGKDRAGLVVQKVLPVAVQRMTTWASASSADEQVRPAFCSLPGGYLRPHTHNNPLFSTYPATPRHQVCAGRLRGREAGPRGGGGCGA